MSSNRLAVRLTAKRVERAAEASGTAQAAAVRGRAALVTARKLVPLPPSPLPDKLYAVIDGTGVPMTSKETAGRDGKGEDGRARTREVKLAVFFTQDKTDDRDTRSGTGTPPAISPPSSPPACSPASCKPKASAAVPATSASSPSSATAPPGSGTSPALVITLGSLAFGAGVAWWALAVTASPDYVSGMLGGMFLTGAGVG